MIPRLTLQRWREEIGRSVLNLDFRCAGDQPFHYTIKPILLCDDLKVALNSHSPGVTFRDQSLLKDGNDWLGMACAVRGRFAFSERRHGTIDVGDATMMRTDIPAELGSNEACTFLSIVFDPSSLSKGVDADRLTSRLWPRDVPGLKLLRSYLKTLKSAKIVPGSELADVARRHVLDLIRLAAHEQTQSPTSDFLASSTIAAARLRIAQEDARAMFRDPGLTEGAVAARQGISSRQLQRIFESAGSTFTGYVQDLRLEAALAALVDPASDGKSVTQIAFASGFSDISNFNRQFRRRFGMTPTAARGR